MLSPAYIRSAKQLSTVVVGVLLFIISEGTFLYVIHRFGAWPTAIFFTIVCGIGSFLLFRWFQHESGSPSRIGRITRWVTTKASAQKQKHRALIASSSLLAILVTALFASVFVATILVGLLGYKQPMAYWMITALNIIVIGFWTLFYSGVLHLFFLYLHP